jgi:predicted nucleotidyltransferase
MNLSELKEKLKFLKKDKEIIAVLLFGSYLTNREYSRDIDICLVLDKKYQNKEMTKKRLYSCTVLPSKFDVQVFQQLPLYIRKRILEKNKIIFCKDEDKFYEIVINTLKEYNLFEKAYRYYMDSIKNEGKNN